MEKDELKYSLLVRFHDRKTGEKTYERRIQGNNQLKILTLIWHIACTRDPNKEYMTVIVDNDNCKEKPIFLIKALRQHEIAVIEEPLKLPES